jgi:hypothetical protein
LGIFKLENEKSREVSMTSNLIQSLPNDVISSFAEEDFLLELPNVEPEEQGLSSIGAPLTQFTSHFQGWMDLYAPVSEVMAYLDAHQGWFCRCAQPMRVEPVGDNGYILVIGRYGSFGYEVEPRIGLNLLPQNAGVYEIQTIPLPEQDEQQYQVDFQAAMNLLESGLSSGDEVTKFGAQHLTKIDWKLDLKVTIQFPRFIHRLPQNIIQRTGDRLLAEIVKQVSNRLTTKVQIDFHQNKGIAIPKKFLKHRSA